MFSHSVILTNAQVKLLRFQIKSTELYFLSLLSKHRSLGVNLKFDNQVVL